MIIIKLKFRIEFLYTQIKHSELKITHLSINENNNTFLL